MSRYRHHHYSASHLFDLPLEGELRARRDGRLWLGGGAPAAAPVPQRRVHRPVHGAAVRAVRADQPVALALVLVVPLGPRPLVGVRAVERHLVAGKEGAEGIDSMTGNFEGLCFESYRELCDYQPGRASIWKKFLLE